MFLKQFLNPLDSHPIWDIISEHEPTGGTGDLLWELKDPHP